MEVLRTDIRSVDEAIQRGFEVMKSRFAAVEERLEAVAYRLETTDKRFEDVSRGFTMMFGFLVIGITFLSSVILISGYLKRQVDLL